MALWPNNRRDIFGIFPTYATGYREFVKASQKSGWCLNYFGNNTIAPTSSVPEGAAESPACIVLPITAGGMASGDNATDIVFSQSANLLSGAPIIGSASFTMTAPNANMSLIIGLGGSASFTMSAANALLALSINLSGSVSWSLTAPPANLGLIVPFGGTANFTLTGTADLKGLCELSGDITPFTELSPQNLAAAVWAEQLEAGYTAEQMMRLISAVVAGLTQITDTGNNTATVVFRNLSDTLDAAVFSVDGSERIARVDDL